MLPLDEEGRRTQGGNAVCKACLGSWRVGRKGYKTGPERGNKSQRNTRRSATVSENRRSVAQRHISVTNGVVRKTLSKRAADERGLSLVNKATRKYQRERFITLYPALRRKGSSE